MDSTSDQDDSSQDASRQDKDLPRFESVSRLEVPKGRSGKHKKFIQELLNDIQQLESNRALKIPLAELPDVKESIRAALNRATRQRGMDVATSSDAEYFYVWCVPPES
jgi:hypothetical protein